MSYQTVYAAVNAVVNCTHMAWREGQAPALPWAVYYLDEENGVDADNTRFTKSCTWCVELYQKSIDLTLQASLENAILTNFGPYSKTETWVDSENCVQTTYYFKDMKG